MKRARGLLVATAGVVVAVVVAGLSACSSFAITAPDAAPATARPGSTASAGTESADGQRTGAFSFGHPVRHDVPSPSEPLDATMRVPFRLGVDATEFRVHIRNRQFDTEEVFASAVRLTGVFVGEQATGPDALAAASGSASPADGAAPTLPTAGASGVFSGTPADVAGATDLGPDGFTSDWISSAEFDLTAHTGYLLSLGLTAEAGATLARSYGLSWLDTAPGASGRAAASGVVGDAEAYSYLDVWIEYRFGGDAPLLVSIGHSLNAPASFAQAEFPISGEESAWPQQWALANDAVAVSLAAPGSVTSVFAPTESKWEEFGTLDPDIVTVWAASNDLALGRPLADIQSDWLAIVAKVKQVWPHAQVVAMTEPPRNLLGDVEANRLAWNAWISRRPPGVDQVVDADAVLRDPLQPSRLRVDLDADNTHFSPAGHALIAERVPVPAHVP